ncbi:MAG: YerC/YecD family TrpR-related protein [Patescibacteria group bacterium]
MTEFKFNDRTTSLFEAILSLKSRREAEAFFRDLCTAEELKEMSDRWQMARLVAAGEPYRQIAAELKTSTTTVSRVASWLNNGLGGYRLALARLDKKTETAHHHASFSKKRS